MGIFERFKGGQASNAELVALQAEYKDITPIKLDRFLYRPSGTPSEGCQGFVNLSTKEVEITDVEAVQKEAGEEIKAELLSPVSGKNPMIIDLINSQKDEGIEPKGTLRFSIPGNKQKEAFKSQGNGFVFATIGKERFTFAFDVWWGVKDALQKRQ